MKYPFKPEQAYIVVFCIFAIGAGCKEAGEYALEKLESKIVSKAPVEQRRRPNSEWSHFHANDERSAGHLEMLAAASVPADAADLSRAE